MITVTKSMKAYIDKILLANSFIYSTPLILVFRNTAIAADMSKSEYIPDNGHNSCDTVFLIDRDLAYILAGRSYPHEKYIQDELAGKGATNYIATGYYRRAWRKGLHRGYPALIQNVKFQVWRSKDEILGNEDDYSYRDIVADNFHGFSPCSAGCVTVKGQMNPPTEDWAIAYNWIYSKDDTFFDACILDFVDIKATPKLRLGSSGEYVEELQSALNSLSFFVKADGDFGPMTFEMLRKYQQMNGLIDNGIVDQNTAAALRLKLQEAA